MTTVRIKEHIDAPIERVFELVTDYARYPDWNPLYVEVKEVRGPVDKVGTRIHAVMRLLGHRMEGWSEIVEIDPPTYVKFEGTSTEGGKLTLIDRLTRAGTGTDVETESEYELPAGFLGHIADKLFVERTVERQLRHAGENFKALAETKTPVLV